MKTPGSTGPAGAVHVMGTGNGRLSDPNRRVTAFTTRDTRRIDWRATAGRLIDLNARG
jgi:hypothetical protein